MGGGGGWGGGGGQRGGGGNGGGGGRRGQNGSATNDLSQLTIDQTASSAKVTSESGEVLALYSAADSSPANSSAGSLSNPPAGSQTSSHTNSQNNSTTSGSNSSSGDSTSAPPAAQWQGAQLVAVTPGRRQGSTTRTYELSPDGKQLYVTTKIDNPRFKNPVTFRLVYDPAQSGG